MPLTPMEKEQLDRIEQKLDLAFHGPDGEPHKGVWVRLDRVEQLARAVGRIAWLAIGAGVAGLVGAFTNHGGNTPPGSHP